MYMYHFQRYTHTALSVSYGTVYTCPMGRLQRWCMYLVVCDAVLVIIIIITIKCAHLGLKRGKQYLSDGLTLPSGELINPLSLGMVTSTWCSWRL